MSARISSPASEILSAVRSYEYAKLLAESREQAIDRMMAQAEKLDANAIVSMQFSTSVIMGGAAEMMAYGTAVIVEDNRQ